MQRLSLLFTLGAGVFSGAAPLPVALPAGTRGALTAEGRIYLWGDTGLWQGTPTAPFRPIAGGAFAAAGCGSPETGFLLQEAAHLVLIRGGRKEVVDTEAAMSDCRAVTLFGRRGWVVAHRGLQVRFYEPPAAPPQPWPYREIYSFYTASYQSGLALEDVDRDGRLDIYCGNYWIRSPERFDLPWRLFAINTYNEEPHAAHVRLALAAPRLLIAAQGEIEGGKLASFVPPADPRQLWREQRLDGDLRLQQPAALASGASGFALGERAGEGRIWWWRRTGSRFLPRLLHSGTPVHTILIVGPDLFAVTADTGLWFRNAAGAQPRR